MSLQYFRAQSNAGAALMGAVASMAAGGFAIAVPTCTATSVLICGDISLLISEATAAQPVKSETSAKPIMSRKTI